MKTLLVDMSPILYGNLFSVMNEVRKTEKKNEEGNLPMDQKQEQMLFFKVLDEISKFRVQFGVDEIVLGFDNAKGGYWRKDIWSGYKYKRASQRADSDVDWEKAFVSFEKLKTLFVDTNFKCIDLEKVEGDDIIFVLSEYLSSKGQEVIIHSLDHDLIYCLKNPGVSYFRTQKTQKKAGEFVNLTSGDIIELELEHLIQGDRGDYIKNVKAYSVFSKEFKEKYPERTPLELWDKRHEVDTIFEKTYGVSAYKQPPYGYKKFLKEKITVKELLNKNIIYKKNYDLNKVIAMPDGIPLEYRAAIVSEYKRPLETDLKKARKFLTENRLFELSGIVHTL